MGTTYAVCNQSDDSVIYYAASWREAERLAAEVRNGDHDGEPRECWIRTDDYPQAQ